MASARHSSCTVSICKINIPTLICPSLSTSVLKKVVLSFLCLFLCLLRDRSQTNPEAKQDLRVKTNPLVPLSLTDMNQNVSEEIHFLRHVILNVSCSAHVLFPFSKAQLTCFIPLALSTVATDPSEVIPGGNHSLYSLKGCCKLLNPSTVNCSWISNAF